MEPLSEKIRRLESVLLECEEEIYYNNTASGSEIGLFFDVFREFIGRAPVPKEMREGKCSQEIKPTGTGSPKGI